MLPGPGHVIQGSKPAPTVQSSGYLEKGPVCGVQGENSWRARSGSVACGEWRNGNEGRGGDSSWKEKGALLGGGEAKKRWGCTEARLVAPVLAPRHQQSLGAPGPLPLDPHHETQEPQSQVYCWQQSTVTLSQGTATVRGASGVMAESNVGAEIEAWFPGAHVPSRLSEVQGSVSLLSLVWTILGIVSGWVCPEQERRVPESLG